MAEKRAWPGVPVPAEKRVQPAAALESVEYEALTGIDYPDGPDNIALAKAGKLNQVTKWVHLDPGDSATDIPAEDVAWLLRCKHIQAVQR